MEAARNAAPIRPTANSVDAALPASGCSATAASAASVDGSAVAVERRRTRHHHEEADNAGEYSARDHVDPLEGEVLGSKLLVDSVGLDER